MYSLTSNLAIAAGSIAFVQAQSLVGDQPQITATATFASSVTGVDQASSVLATVSLTPNRGNPAGNVYPNCTVSYRRCSFRVSLLIWNQLTCVAETAELLTDTNDLYQICGVEYRTQTAVCEAALCSAQDRQSTYTQPIPAPVTA